MERSSRFNARGITLLEAVITIVLVGVMLVAAINTVAVSKAGQRIIRDDRAGRQLAEQLMDEILSQPYADESVLETLLEEVLVWDSPTAVTLGPDGVEGDVVNRTLFDDIDDYHLWTASPPIDADGKSMTEYSEYERQVVVKLSSADDARDDVAQETGARRVMVRVLRNGVQVAQLNSVVALGPVPTQAIFMPDGSCMDLPANVGQALGGTAQGTGTLCAMIAPEIEDGIILPPPIHHWEMDEGSGSTVADSAGGFDATLTAADPATMWKSGVIGSAVYFDGSGDIATTASKFTPPDEGTVAFWMRAPGEPLAHGRIFGIHDEWEVRHVQDGTPDGVTGGVVFDLGWNGINTEFATTVAVDEPGRWYHIAATYSALDGNYAVYIDGVADATGSATLAMPSTKEITLGTRTDSTNFFNGILDDVRIYDQVLTAEQVAALSVPAPQVLAVSGFSQKKQASKFGLTLEIATPAGTEDDDLLIAVVATDGKQTASLRAPAGWSQLLAIDQGAAVTIGIWGKLASGEPGTHTFVWSQSYSNAYGWITRITGHDGSDWLESGVYQGTSSGVTLTPPCPSSTSASDEVLVLRIGAFDDRDIVAGDPGLPAHRVITMNSSASSGNSRVSGGGGYRVLLGPGDSGASTFSLTEEEDAIGVTILIKADAGLEVAP